MTSEFLLQLCTDDIKAAIVPIECLALLKEDIARFRDTEKLNGYQNWIVRKDMPESLVSKLDVLGIDDWRLEVMPKCMKAVFDHAKPGH